MYFKTTTSGIWPKVASNSAIPSLRANLHKFDRGEISDVILENVIQKNIERAVTEQKTAGIDLPTCGLIRWTDLFSPFVKAWTGLTRRGIHRFLDTNTLYGEPVIEAKLKFQPSHVSTDFALAQKFGAQKATLPGVFTFATACVDNFYHDEVKLRAVIAENLINEAIELKKIGAKLIEIHEPALARAKFESKEITMIFQKFSELEIPIIVVSYFQNFNSEVAQILAEAGMGIGLDFSTQVEIAELPKQTILQAGIINTRETKLETTEFLKSKKTEILKKFDSAKEILFSTTTAVELLPHDRALKKIEKLAAIVNRP